MSVSAAFLQNWGLFNDKIDFLKVLEGLRSKHRESLEGTVMDRFLLLRNRLWIDGVVDVSDAVNTFLRISQ